VTISRSRLSFCAFSALVLSFLSLSTAYAEAPELAAQTNPTAQQTDATSQAVQPGTVATTESQAHAEAKQRERAQRELKEQEHQRILGIIPNFNTSNVQNAAPLSVSQKFHLALKSGLDPFQFVAAGLDAALSQANNDFPGYGQGAEGYGKRFGASYADSFDGVLLGGAVFPSLLHQDPRYFRKGTGTFMNRFVYSLESTVRCKSDSGNWQPNYSNILGNIASGGISNLYYPSGDRGAGLTFQRAVTVTAEGAIGAFFVEFWPDISRKVFHKH
jgi:hypothetical protein